MNAPYVFAYIGPGLSAGGIGIILGIIVSVFLAVVGIVWYPLKRLLRAFRGKASLKKSGRS